MFRNYEIVLQLSETSDKIYYHSTLIYQIYNHKKDCINKIKNKLAY